MVLPGVGHAVVGADPSGCGRRQLLRFVAGERVRTRCPRAPTDVPATGVPPVSFAALAPAAGLEGRVGRTVSAVDATLDFLGFALSPALDAGEAGGGLRGGTYRYRRAAVAPRRRGRAGRAGERIGGRVGNADAARARRRGGGRDGARHAARPAERPPGRPARRGAAGEPPAARASTSGRS